MLLCIRGWTVKATTHRELTWHHSLWTICICYQQTFERSEGGCHANFSLYTTFRRQNHGSLERFRPVGDSRLVARNREPRGDEQLAVAPEDPAVAIRPLGPEPDR